jgi:protein O-GlcNAc transferase
MAQLPTIADIHREMESHNFDAARTLCQRLLRGDAKNGDALTLAGLLEAQRGDDAKAVEWFDKAIKQLPRRWDLYHNVGMILRRMGRLENAVLRLRKAVLLNPEAGEAHLQLGLVLGEQGDYGSSIAVLKRAVDCLPENGLARLSLAEALHNHGRVEAAAAQYERAISLDEDLPTAWFGQGHIQLAAGQHAQAAESFARCVALDDAMVRGWFGWGCAELGRNDNVAAARAFRRCVELEPDYAEAHQNLGQALFKLGELDEAMEHFTRVIAIVGDDASRRRLLELARRSIAVAIPGWSRASHAEVRDARAAWGEMQHVRPVSVRNQTSPGDGRLRIGYISAFFGRDNWMKPVWGLVNQHDRTRFHVHLFHDGEFYGAPNADGGRPTPPTAYRPHEDDVVCDLTGLDNDAAAELIAGQNIDVLVDLNGYSKMDRLAVFARRPAPVIAAWFNQFATTGVPWFGFLIGDRHVIRDAELPFYTERVLHVDGSYLTFAVDYPVPEVQLPPCVRRGYVTFGCLASQYKITDEVLAAWGEILRRAPTARLLLKNADSGIGAHQDFFRDKLAALGIAADRVSFGGPAKHFEFLDAYREVDIALDTFPYNGGTTTTEALWQGVPVVAFDGDRWASRTSATLLREAGLGEWVATDLAGYVDRAVQWATDPEAAGKLAGIRSAMRERLRAAKVCDTVTFARSMEGLFEQMWRQRASPAQSAASE